MEHPAAEASDGPLKIDFDRRLKLDFHGSNITWFGPRPAPEAAGMAPLDLGETEHTVIRAYLQNHPKPQSRRIWLGITPFVRPRGLRA